MQYHYYLTTVRDHPELMYIVFVDANREYPLIVSLAEADDGYIQDHFADLLDQAMQANQPYVPTQLDRIEAQILYTALMTDTLLDEEAE